MPVTPLTRVFPALLRSLDLCCLPLVWHAINTQPTKQQSTMSGSTRGTMTSLASGSVGQALWAPTAATRSTLPTFLTAPPPAPSTTSTTAKTPNTTTTTTWSPAPLCECVSHTPFFNTPVSHTPVSDTPVSHTPVSHTPVSDTPVSHTPVSHTAGRPLMSHIMGRVHCHTPNLPASATPRLLPVCSVCCFPLLSRNTTQVPSPFPLQHQLRRLHRPAQHPARIGHGWGHIPLQAGHCRRGRPHPRLLRLDCRCAHGHVQPAACVSFHTAAHMHRTG